MTVGNHPSAVDLIDLAAIGSIHEGRAGSGSEADVLEADRLIRDLAALIDAGLVVVEPHVLGPARYAVPPPQLDDAA